MASRIGPWLLATVALAAALGALGASLTTAAAPAGILSLELAVTPARAAAILASWDGPARRAAAAVQALDTGFPAVYVQLGRALVARFTASPARWSAALAAAGLLDAVVENPALDLILWSGTPTAPLVAVAAAAASAKILLLAASAVAVAAGALSGARAR